MFAMCRVALFVLFLFLSRVESRVSFTTAEVLDNVDFKGNDEVNLNCFNGCRVFSPTKNDDIFIIDSNRTRIISLLEISELDNGVNLNVGEFYSLVNRGPANPSFILYAAQRQSPNFMTKVVYLDATKSLKVDPKDTFGVLTVLSTSGAVNVNGLSGDYEVYATGFDAVNDCRPVYQSRSIANAQKTFVKVNGPIATMRLKGYLAGAMLTLSGDPDLPAPVTVDSSAVFVSKGYVGCKNPGRYSLVPTTNAPEDTSFTLADNGGLSVSINSDYSFVKSGTTEVDITVNGEVVRLTGTDHLRKTFDPAASVKVDFAWKNRRSDDVFAIQIDVLKKAGGVGETKLTTLSAPDTVQTTTTKIGAQLSSAMPQLALMLFGVATISTLLPGLVGAIYCAWTRRKQRKGAPTYDLNIPIDFKALGIGGLDKELTEIRRRALASRTLSPQEVEELEIQHVRGILLYGPPGTGKTLIARKIGGLLKATTTRIVNGPEILDKYVGVPEQRIRELFAAAECDQDKSGAKSGLHVIIFDEIDAICKKRGEMDNHVNDTIVDQLLAKMDGIKQLNNILVIGITNLPELLDSALLRPGRFEIQMEINLPDEAGRLQILEIRTAKLKENNKLDGSVNLKELAKKTKHFSGAGIAGLITMADFKRALGEKVTKKEEDQKVDESSSVNKSEEKEHTANLTLSKKKTYNPFKRVRHYVAKKTYDALRGD